MNKNIVSNNITKRRKELEVAKKERKLLKVLKTGRQALIDNKSEFIPRNQNTESIEDYNEKLSCMLLVNHLKETIDNYCSKIFKKPLSIYLSQDSNESNDNEKNREIIDNIKYNFNGSGTDINEFMRNLINDALWYSQAHVIVDFERLETNYTPSGTAQHYVSLLDLDSILDYRYNSKELIYFRFYNIKEEYIEEEFTTNYRYHINEYIKKDGVVYYNEYKATNLLGNNTLIENYDFERIITNEVLNSTIIPLFSFYPFSSIYKFNPVLEFKDIAELQLAHFKKTGEKNFLEKTVSSPVIIIKGSPMDSGVEMIDEDGNSRDVNRNIQINSRTGFNLTEPGSDIKWLEAPSNTLEPLRTSILDLEEQIKSMTNSLLDKKGSITATEIAVNESRNNASLYSISNMLQKVIVENIVDYILNWSNQNIEYKTSLTSDFSIETNKTEQKDFLDTALSNNVISRRIYFNELQNRGVISENLNFEKDQENVKSDLQVTNDIYKLSYDTFDR